MLPPNTVFFETECIQEVRTTIARKDYPWLIEIPPQKSKKLQLKVGMFVSIWLVSSSKKDPPNKPIWFRAQIRQIPPTYLVYIPTYLVSENNLANSKKLKVFLSPERLRENAEILNHYLVECGVRIRYAYTTYGCFGINEANYLLVFGSGFGRNSSYLSTFNGLKMEEIPYSLSESFFKKLQSIDLQKEKNAAFTSEAYSSYGSNFILSINLDKEKSTIITGDRMFSKKFNEFIRMVQVLANYGINGLTKYVQGKEQLQR